MRSAFSLLPFPEPPPSAPNDERRWNNAKKSGKNCKLKCWKSSDRSHCVSHRMIDPLFSPPRTSGVHSKVSSSRFRDGVVSDTASPFPPLPPPLSLSLSRSLSPLVLPPFRLPPPLVTLMLFGLCSRHKVLSSRVPRFTSPVVLYNFLLAVCVRSADRNMHRKIRARIFGDVAL